MHGVINDTCIYTISGVIQGVDVNIIDETKLDLRRRLTTRSLRQLTGHSIIKVIVRHICCIHDILEMFIPHDDVLHVSCMLLSTAQILFYQ